MKIEASAENIVDSVAHYPALTRGHFQAAIKETADSPLLVSVVPQGSHDG
ncbi:hypothetical protein F652_941 [Enterobacteriaceae bacterium bta3-1]|nr:hypothetical protein F652_941 [Enterobacteriaceae bacterium bta3-1]